LITPAEAALAERCVHQSTILSMYFVCISCAACLPAPQEITPERGFSSFKFLPGSRDTVIVALKSEENSATDAQTSYLTIYGEQADGSWRVLLEETELPGAAKFEGLEVIDPPPY
jgi:hypothetical protein